MIKKDFSITTFIEIKTVTGQLLDIQCRREDIDKIKELSELIYHVEQPVTKEIKNVCHGGFGRYTRFDIKQKKYAGGGCGYIECLKINNPPDNRNGNIIHQYDSESIFYEYETIEDAIDTWENFWHFTRDGVDKNLCGSRGFIRRVSCGWFSPWFYAVSNQALCGDFVFPETTGIDHPIYRPFNKFVIEKEIYDDKKEEYIKEYEIKTCIGYTEKDEKTFDYYRTYKVYTIYWDDGTCWSSSSLESAPKPIEREKYKILLKRKICDYEKMEKFT